MKANLYFTYDREQPYYKGTRKTFDTLKELQTYLDNFRTNLKRTNGDGYLYLKYTITTQTIKSAYIEMIHKQELLVSSH
jgi:hypothetical protein